MNRGPAAAVRRAATVVMLAISLVLATVSATATAGAADDLADLAASMGPASAQGEIQTEITFRASLSNVGSSDSGPAKLRVGDGFGVSLISFTSTAASCSTADVFKECAVANLAPGQSISVDLRYRVQQVGDSTVEVEAFRTDHGDANYGNNTARVVITGTPASATITLSAAPGSTPAAPTVTLSAVVTSNGAPVVTGFIELYRRDAGQTAWAQVDAQGTDVSGRATFEQRPIKPSEYQARVAGSYDIAASQSPIVAIGFGYTVWSRVSPVATPPGAKVTVEVTARPAVAGSTVTVQRRVPGGAWTTIATPAVDERGVARVNSTISKLGVHTFRALRPADGQANAAAEARTTVTVTGRGSSKAWAPLSGSKTRPAFWGSCRLTYYVNPRHIPRHGFADLKEALRRVGLVTGLRFRYAGKTSATPSFSYRGPGRNRFVVAWVTPAESRGLVFGPIAGTASPTFSRGRITTGTVAINANWSRTAPGGFGAGSPHGGVLMHELGHLIGLDHAADRWQIMAQGRSLPASVWGAGDLAGLRKLGRAGGCRS